MVANKSCMLGELSTCVCLWCVRVFAQTEKQLYSWRANIKDTLQSKSLTLLTCPCGGFHILQDTRHISSEKAAFPLWNCNVLKTAVRYVQWRVATRRLKKQNAAYYCLAKFPSGEKQQFLVSLRMLSLSWIASILLFSERTLTWKTDGTAGLVLLAFSSASAAAR